MAAKKQTTSKNEVWKTMFQTPVKGELCVIAILPDIVRMGVWNGKGFENALGMKVAGADDVAYWMSIPTPPWRKDRSEKVHIAKK